MKQFMDEHFLLQTKTAQKLYHEYAKDQKIYDYHCHLDPKEIAREQKVLDHYRCMARRRPLQVARHACQWSPRGTGYRKGCRSL